MEDFDTMAIGEVGINVYGRMLHCCSIWKAILVLIWAVIPSPTTVFNAFSNKFVHEGSHSPADCRGEKEAAGRGPQLGIIDAFVTLLLIPAIRIGYAHTGKLTNELE